MKVLTLVFIFTGLLFIACPPDGQAQQKRPPRVDEYGLWSTLYTEQLSKMGNWVSYRKDYENRTDTLFVASTKKGKKYAFAEGVDGRFIGEDYFGCLLPKGIYALVNLTTGQLQQFNGISDFQIFSNKSIVLSGRNGESAFMEIRTGDGHLLKRIENVDVLKVSPTGDQMMYACHDASGSVAVLYHSDHTETVIAHSESKAQVFVNPSWNALGNAVAFLTQESDGTIGNGLLYDTFAQQLRILDPSVAVGFPKGTQLLEGYNPIVISDDRSKVFIRFRPKVKSVKDEELAQVWNGNDTFIYPQRQQFAMMQSPGHVGVWQVEQNRFQSISNDSLFKVVLSGKHSHALTYNPLDVKHPKNLFDEQTDFYLTDLSNGNTKLWLEGHSTAPYATRVSPGGAYFAYWRENDWYVYDIASGVHTSLSALLPDIPFRDGGGEPERHDLVGFSADDRNVFLSDGTDIWEIDISKLAAHRITDGIETNTVYQAYFLPQNYDSSYFDGMVAHVLDTEAGFYLTARGGDLKRSGYFKWSRPLGLQPLVFKEGAVDQLRFSNTGKYVYCLQNYEQPPVLVVAQGNQKGRTVVKSNPQHQKFLWGQQELVHYKNAQGASLRGVLYYPAGYVKGRQYPIVVSIYEMQSDHYASYVNPSVYERKGFNIADFTARGYLVLEPDITYEMGNPGLSAVFCVTSAVAAVAAKGILKTGSVGLIGHSFGSYQTNFIITQTGMFAAAVSGAGISDMRRFYLSIGLDTARPDLWRFEHQQFRMQKSLFDDPERYRRNSPIEYVQQVRTPLLSWTGAADPNVQPEQTIAFYLALRRLGKKQVMLVYPEEPHAIINPQNQNDLSKRVREWFDYYLKGEPVSWITEGTR